MKDFHKKFSVGLAMNTTLGEFENMISQYGDYIDNIYCSIPLGDQFHGRTYVAEQFRHSEVVDRFWKLVKIINDSGIDLEIVFNTDHLTEDDFLNCRRELDNHHVKVQKICVLEGYYDLIKRIFPEVLIVNSVNNMRNSKEEIRSINIPFDEIVIGRQYIRDSEVFRIVSEELHAGTVLLLNNGCSHICGGCRSFDYCRLCYETAKNKYSPEYLYALQSIMPYEIHEDYFDISGVKLLKLSTRNADTELICKCLDSYINNKVEEYLEKGVHHYMMWARLKWHMDYYDSFDPERIKSLKKQICKIL